MIPPSTNSPPCNQHVYYYYSPPPPPHHPNLMFMNFTTTMIKPPSCPPSQTLASDSSGGSGRYFLPEIQIVEIFLAVLVFVVIHSVGQRRRQGLPVWPFLGMLPSLVSGLQVNMYEWFSSVLIRQNGTFTFKGPWFSSMNCVITSDPRNVEHILKSKFANFPKGGYFRDTLQDLLGNGIFNADDDTWRRQRRTASIEFHSSKFRKLTSESLLELVHARLLPILEESGNKSLPIDLQDVLLRLTFDNVCMIAFGVDPGCLNPNSSESEIPFAKAFEDATEASLLRFIMPTLVWKTMRYMDFGSEYKLRKSIEKVDEFATEVIATRKKELASKFTENNKQRSDLLTIFMGLEDEQGKPYSDKFLRDICVNFILAGRDTSSVALSWFFWLIGRNPAVEERILSEIGGIIGERGEEIESPVVFRPEELKKMDYLQAALSEALRLYPSVPVDHKEVVEDDVFPDGTHLKKGTKIIYAIYAMGRMESIWGKDCREYKPERWLRSDGRYSTESAYKFTAFNGGPRLCLGKDFAYYQMKYVAAAILLRYRVAVAENHPIVPKLALTMYMKHGLKVNLLRRDGDELQKYFQTSKTSLI